MVSIQIVLKNNTYQEPFKKSHFVIIERTQTKNLVKTAETIIKPKRALWNHFSFLLSVSAIFHKKSRADKG
jgi:hypothetical protein